MKRQFITYVFLLVVSTNMLYSQRITITSDSLKTHFKQETVNEVLYYYLNNLAHLINYKDLYYDKISKDSLLRWLDDDVIIKQKVYQRKNYITKYFNDESKKSLTRNYVQGTLKLNFDSIYPDSKLYELYYEYAVSASVDRYKQDILKKEEELLPPDEVLYLHSKIVYPEAYKKIKQWWYMNNKSEKSSLFGYMLMMNDPEAQHLFDIFIEKAIKNNGESITSLRFISKIKEIENAYSVKKLLKILPIRKDILVISGDPLVPYDLFVYEALLEMLEQNNIEGDFISFSQLVGMGIPKESKYLRDHRGKIEEAANRLIMKLEKEEKYWMDNIPFDYVPKSN